MQHSESQPLLGNGHSSNGLYPHRRSFIQKVLGVLLAGGQPGWIASTRSLLFSSRLSILLIFIPFSLVAGEHQWDAGLRFAFSFIAIIPLTRLLGETVGYLSIDLPQMLGALLNMLFGNAAEIIIGVAALLRGELRIVQAFMLGSILSNLLLVLGLSFLVGGLCWHEQNFQVTAAQTTSSLMTLACIMLVIPAAYHSSQNHSSMPITPKDALVTLMDIDTPFGNKHSHEGLLFISRVTAVILLVVYVVYLIFQLKTHTDLFASAMSDDEDEEVEGANMSVVSEGFWLLAISAITFFCADVLVGSIEDTAGKYHIPKLFIGLVLLPPVANTVEYVTSIRMATEGRPEIVIGASVGSSIQIAAFVVPVLVILSWIIGKELTLYFADFETIMLFVAVVLVNLLIGDGKTNYMEGMMLCSLYIIIAVAFWVS